MHAYRKCTRARTECRTGHTIFHPWVTGTPPGRNSRPRVTIGSNSTAAKYTMMRPTEMDRWPFHRSNNIRGPCSTFCLPGSSRQELPGPARAHRTGGQSRISTSPQHWSKGGHVTSRTACYAYPPRAVDRTPVCFLLRYGPLFMHFTRG